MEPMTLREIARAAGTVTELDAVVTHISTDTRALPTGCLFIALSGERFDGHDFVAQALQAGAAFAMIHRDCDIGGVDPARILRVKNTQDALMAIGGAYRRRFDIRCVGITGSVGKTTTKDMIAAVVSAGFETLKTEGNLNNEIGLPKTLLQLTGAHRAAVIEMGMQGPGEIAALAACAGTDIGVITNIGVSHIERLGSREAILRAKLELADALPDGAPLILCGDNDLLQTVRDPRLRVITYGIRQKGCDWTAKSIREEATETAFVAVYNPLGESAQVRLPCTGMHNVNNALAAMAVGREMGMELSACARALEGYVPSGMRQKPVKWLECTVVEDCYNAAPDSMRAALETLGRCACAGKRIAVLGDMLELGEIARREHIDIGGFAARQKVDLLVAYGTLAEYYAQGARAFGVKTVHAASAQQAAETVKNAAVPGSVIWVKGSRGMRMEEILEKLYAQG